MVSLEWSGTNSWQLSRLARNLNTTYMLFIMSVSYKRYQTQKEYTTALGIFFYRTYIIVRNQDSIKSKALISG